MGYSPEMNAAAPQPTEHRRPLAWSRPARLRAFETVERHATWLELFFDLCFVAAVAALAAGLHDAPNLGGLLRFAGLFVPVWWAWMGFTWYATAFDTDDLVFRLAFLLAMLAAIGLSASIAAGHDRMLTGFVIASAVMQALLALLYLRVSRSGGEAKALALRYAVGDGLGALLWLASLPFEPPARYAIWALAMATLMLTPIVAILVLQWQSYDSTHIPERYGLFTLIVLGESIVGVVTGTARTGWNPGAVLTALAGFGIAACIWWIYFDYVKATVLSSARMVAAFIWGYGHLLIFAGIAAAAVGVRLAVEGAAAGNTLTAGARLVLGGGLAACLLAIGAIQWVTVRTLDTTAIARLGAAIAVAITAALGAALPAPALMAVLLAIFVGESLVEILGERRRAA
jgi:low temperature requirement protein LtrA